MNNGAKMSRAEMDGLDHIYRAHGNELHILEHPGDDIMNGGAKMMIEAELDILDTRHQSELPVEHGGVRYELPTPQFNVR